MKYIYLSDADALYEERVYRRNSPVTKQYTRQYKSTLSNDVIVQYYNYISKHSIHAI